MLITKIEVTVKPDLGQSEKDFLEELESFAEQINNFRDVNKTKPFRSSTWLDTFNKNMVLEVVNRNYAKDNRFKQVLAYILETILNLKK